MGILDVASGALDGAKRKIESTKQKYKYWKYNREFKEQAELTYDIAVCNGEMEACLKDFNRVIKEQTRSLTKGMKQGMYTQVNEDILWDAAIGYMMVKEAIFALSTVTSYDSITHAYEILNVASQHISGSKSSDNKSKFLKKRSRENRDGYDYITSEETLKEKEELLSAFFNELKLTGDIEKCLSECVRPANMNAARRGKYTGRAGTDTQDEADILLSRLGEVFNDEDDFSDISLDDLWNTTPKSESE